MLRFQIQIRNDNIIPDLTFVNFNWKYSASLRYKTTITGVQKFHSHLLKLWNLAAKHCFTMHYKTFRSRKKQLWISRCTFNWQRQEMTCQECSAGHNCLNGVLSTSEREIMQEGEGGGRELCVRRIKRKSSSQMHLFKSSVGFNAQTILNHRELHR